MSRGRKAVRPLFLFYSTSQITDAVGNDELADNIEVENLYATNLVNTASLTVTKTINFNDLLDAADIKANAVENLEVARTFIQSNSFSFDVTPNANVHVNSVSFVAAFGTPPIVILNAENTATTVTPADVSLTVSNITTSGFDVFLENSAPLADGDIKVHWIAMIPKI